jgi:hypothetical protein
LSSETLNHGVPLAFAPLPVPTGAVALVLPEDKRRKSFSVPDVSTIDKLPRQDFRDRTGGADRQHRTV